VEAVQKQIDAERAARAGRFFGRQIADLDAATADLESRIAGVQMRLGSAPRIGSGRLSWQKRTALQTEISLLRGQQKLIADKRKNLVRHLPTGDAAIREMVPAAEEESVARESWIVRAWNYSSVRAALYSAAAVGALYLLFQGASVGTAWGMVVVAGSIALFVKFRMGRHSPSIFGRRLGVSA